MVPQLTEEQIHKYVSSDGFIDPAAYGAVGDGIQDDTEALQMAIDSGYNVRLQDTTYFIAGDHYLRISQKNDFHMEGGTIHKEASPSNYFLFVIKDCSNCSFSNMNIYSEFAYKDILIPKDHMRPSETLNSNVLAFSGAGNTSILFKNNTFDHMGSDYWFNSSEDAFWKDITVDGWNSSTSLLPMYTQCITGLTVKNADVALHPGSGDGDHCMYVCYKSSDVSIENSTFTGNDSDLLQGATVVLTFHGGNEKTGSQPKNIRIANCNIQALTARAIYCEEGTDITISDSTLTQEMQDSSQDIQWKTPVFGYGSVSFQNCMISAGNRVFEGFSDLSLVQSRVSGAESDALITNVTNVQATDSQFFVNGGAAVYMNENSHPVHLYENCNFEKSGCSLPYILSDRSSDGRITLTNCSVDAGNQWLVYNGSIKNTSSLILNDTALSNFQGIDMTEESGL